jgi:transposase
MTVRIDIARYLTCSALRIRPAGMQTLRKKTVVIGYEESSQLDVEPAKYFVLFTKREKRACRSREDLAVVSSPLPPRIIEKCLASNRIVIETVVGKYCHHTPLHRQSMILERDLRLDISRATLDGWVLKVGELPIPIFAAVRRDLISGSCTGGGRFIRSNVLHGAAENQ